MTSSRRAARFATHQQVELEASGRGEIEKLWSENISRGGLFVATESPPPLRSHVEVVITVPDGKLRLKAEVVHIVDSESAPILNMPAGVGLHFIEVPDKAKSAVARYCDGLSDQLKIDTQTIDLPSAAPAVNEAAALTQQIFSCVEKNDLYGALDIDRTAEHDKLFERIEEMNRILEAPQKTLTHAQHARVEAAKRVLARVGRLLLDPERRRDFDRRTPG